MRFEKDWGRLGLRYKNLSDFSIGKGTYGISASAVGKDDNLPTYLRITDINDDGTINFASLKSVDRSDADKYRLQPNDIVFARTGGSTGRSYFYDGKDGEFVFAGFLIKFSIDPQKCIPKFIKYYCQSREYYNWVASFNTGSTRGNINAKTFEKMPIPDLPLEQQQLIVDILSPIDDKIENNKKINHHLEQMALSIFKEEFSKKEVTNKLGDFFPVITGKKDANIAKGGEYPFFSCSQNISYTDNYSFDARAILLAGNGDFNVKIFNGKFEAYQRTYVLIPNNDEHFGYLYYAIKYFLNDITSGHRGSVIKFITKGQIEHFDIFMTSNKEKLFLFNSFIENIANNNKEIDKLTNIRDTLLPKLLSGEISVNQATK